MKRKAGFFFSLLLTCGVFAQNSGETLDQGGVRFHVQNAGVLFQQNGGPGFEVPKGSGLFTMLSSGLWIGGLDSSGGIRLAIACYDSSGRDFQPGPLDLGTVLPDDSSFWNYTWHIDSAQIETHKSAFNNSGYQAPWGIENWPGTTDRPGNFSPVLAPFIDLNSNLKYEPDSGEVPYFKGREAAYVIFNDKRLTHEQSGTQPMGLEVYGLIFTDASLPDVVFVQYRIVNRSFSRYDSVYTGIFTDFLLGKPDDNYVSTDANRNTYFCYNALAYDTGHYLDSPPVMGVKFLNTTLDRTISFNYDPYDNRGWPGNPQDYFNYLKAVWKDGSLLKDPTSAQTSHQFLGDPCSGSGWTEYGGSGILPGRRNMLGTTGPVTMNHGDVIKLDVAYIFTRKQKDVQDNVCDFYTDADAVQSYWQEHISSFRHPDKRINLKVYPNPASGILRWQLPEEVHVREISLVDMQGKSLKINPADREIETRDLTDGIYLLRIQDSEGNIYSQKVVLE